MPGHKCDSLRWLISSRERLFTEELMIQFQSPADEAARLEALNQYRVLDTSPEPAFDDLSRLAAQLCETPIALISVVDGARVWFKSTLGIAVTEVLRDASFCAHAILQADLFVVENAAQDKRFVNNPFVTSAPNIQFYAGAPLMTPEGHAIGTLCVLDQTPRTLRPDQAEAMQALARQVIDQLELRRNLFSLVQALDQRRQMEQALRESEKCSRQQAVQLQQALNFEAMLKRITDKVRDSLDKNQILQAAMQELVLVLGVNSCNAALYELERGTSTVCYEYANAIPLYQGRVAQMSNAPEIYRQLLQGQHFQFCSLLPNPVRGRVAMLACPILDDQGVLGDLWLVNQPDYVFSSLEIRLVQQVANQCAIAIRQARLFQAAQAQVEELETLNQLKNDFLSTVSHELRTPMANIKMAIHMLRLSLTSDTPNPVSAQGRSSSRGSSIAAVRREHYLEILEAECARETELINNLLDLQRLEAAAYPVVPETINLRRWLSRIIEPFQLRTSASRQQLQVSLPPSLPAVVTDSSSLERILAELLNNACKYTPPGGQINLKVQYSEGAMQANVTAPWTQAVVTFIVSNAAEISAAQLPRIFEKFYRVPKADPWQQGGTGLGLTLVQKLVEQLQGSIQVTSEAGWTIFTVQLPAQALPEVIKR